MGNPFSRTRLTLTELEDRTTPVANYTVNNFTDTVIVGQTNLREAITLANNSPNFQGNDIISFVPPALSDDGGPPPQNVIALNSALPVITEGVFINGALAGQSPVTITRAGNAGPFRILTIDMPTTLALQSVHLQSLVLSGGYAGGVVDDGNGGGIWTRGSSLTLSNTVVAYNGALGNGGGIWAIGFNDPARVEDVTLDSNSQILNNSAVHGGGAFVVNLYFRVFGGTVSNNTASQSGGGIAAYAQNYIFKQLVEIKNGFVENNQAQEGDDGGI